MHEIEIRYEYIIQAAHKINRLGIRAAHADVFRNLERVFVNYQENQSEENIKNYAFACGVIATNLAVALEEFEKKNTVNQTESEELNSIEYKLSNAERKEIIECIESIEIIFRNHELIA